MITRKLLSVFVMTIFLSLFIPSISFAEVTNAGVLDDALSRYQAASTTWSVVIIKHASFLFWSLATISLVWTHGFMILRKADIGEFFSEFIRFTIFVGFYWWILTNGPKFAMSIIQSMRKIGAEAAGLGTDGLSPSGIVDIGFDVFYKVLDQSSVWKPTDSLVGMLIAAAILIIFALIATNMLLMLISGWVLAYAGAFFLGFGGSKWTSDMAINYYKNVLGLGASLMVMTLLIGIGRSFIDHYYKQMGKGLSLKEMAVMLVITVVLFVLTNTIPKTIAGLSGGGSAGTPPLGGGAALAGVGMAVGALATGAAMAKAGATAAAGGASALKAAFASAQQSMAEGSGRFGDSESSGGEGGGGGQSLAAAMGDGQSGGQDGSEGGGQDGGEGGGQGGGEGGGQGGGEGGGQGGGEGGGQGGGEGGGQGGGEGGGQGGGEGGGQGGGESGGQGGSEGGGQGDGEGGSEGGEGGGAGQGSGQNGAAAIKNAATNGGQGGGDGQGGDGSGQGGGAGQGGDGGGQGGGGGGQGSGQNGAAAIKSAATNGGQGGGGGGGESGGQGGGDSGGQGSGEDSGEGRGQGGDESGENADQGGAGTSPKTPTAGKSSSTKKKSGALRTVGLFAADMSSTLAGAAKEMATEAAHKQVAKARKAVSETVGGRIATKINAKTLAAKVNSEGFDGNSISGDANDSMKDEITDFVNKNS